MNPENYNFQQEARRQDEISKSDKELRWQQKLVELNEVADGLGLEIDKGITETVAILQIYEFDTIMSCEGHLAEKGEERHGYPYPWVHIEAPEPEGMIETEERQQNKESLEWMRKNYEQQRKMMDLLAEFYQERQTPFDARIIFSEVGWAGGFRIQSMGADMTVILPRDEKISKLMLYQKEMEDFTVFLKNKYLN